MLAEENQMEKSNQIELESKTVWHKDFLKDLVKISAKISGLLNGKELALGG